MEGSCDHHYTTKSGAALWHIRLRHRQQCQHPIQMQIQILAAPLTIQLPINAPVEATEDGPSA